MELPITEQELNSIIELLKHKIPTLYNKLWLFKMSKGKTNGLS